MVEASAVKKLVTDKAIAYHKAYSDICDGSVVGGVFLAQVLYWGDKGTDEDGWFWKTHRQWQVETGLSRDQQVSARAKLVSIGILEEKICGVPAKLYFKVSYAKFAEALRSCSPTPEVESPDVAIPTTDVAIPTPSCSHDHTIKDSESTSENTTESTSVVEPRFESSKANFKAFRTRWRSAARARCPAGKSEITFRDSYERACAQYGEDEVLAMVDEYGPENAEWIKKFHGTPRQFFEVIDEIAEARKLTAQRVESTKFLDPYRKGGPLDLVANPSKPPDWKRNG